MMRLGAVVKPKNALLIFALSYKAEIARCQQLSSRFSQRAKHLLRSATPPSPPGVQAAIFIRYKLQVTLSLRKECIESRHITRLSRLPSLHQGTDDLAKSTRGMEQ